ncbi:MAG TPA: trigger factor [Opitutae bacterium]|nr:trigger factor [Opitutae bacterium]
MQNSIVLITIVNVDIKDAGVARKIATVNFDSDEVSKHESKVCQELGKLVSIPGFRKGKAPANVIRKKYAKELREELNRKVSTAAYEAVLEQKDIKIYSVLKVDAGELEPSQSASVEVTVDIEPEFDLPKYKEFELTIEPTEVKEEDITKELDAIREQRASFDVVERAAEKGDYVKCSYEGTLDGASVAELIPEKPMYGKQANTWEEAGNQTGMGVDAIADGVLGMSTGDKKELNADFAKDFEVKALAGKSVTYQLEVHEVREKKAPELDDEEFLKSLKIESVNELKEKVTEQIKIRKEQENENLKRKQITQNILDLEDFPLPQQAVEEEAKAIFQNRIQQASRQGVNPEEIEKNRDEWWNESQTQGQSRVKLTLVLSKIAEEEKVTVEKEDLAQAATREAMMRREDPTKFIKELSQDRARLNRLREDIVYDKTLIKISQLSKELICDIEGEHTH